MWRPRHLRLKHSNETIILGELSLEMMAQTLLNHTHAWLGLSISDESFYAGVEVTYLGQSMDENLCWTRYYMFLTIQFH
jgi:hypothetical protein